MAGAATRLKGILGHLGRFQGNHRAERNHIHTLSPTFFLERAAQIEPDAEAIYHIAADGAVVQRTYAQFADRARGLAYYLKKQGRRRIGVLAPNTPAFLESIYGIVGAGGVIVPVNTRLKPEDIAYIFDFAEVDCIVVDSEYEPLLVLFRRDHSSVPFIVDTVSTMKSSNVWSFKLTVAQGRWYKRGRSERSIRRCDSGRSQPR
jgi:acyl-CoA synthetase (AMP-forming)/AMP-acid ligase II